MARVLFAKGVQGEIARRIQRSLTQLGFDTGGVDGKFGDATVKALKAFQTARQLAATGEVDAATWQALTGEPVPPVRDRALGVTGSFEGHDFTLAQGNFDGAGITWGIIGFNLKSGSLKKVVQEIEKSHPDRVRQAFGSKADQLLEVLKGTIAQQIAFGDGISLTSNKARLAEPWRSAFATFGEFPEVQAVQLALADSGYFQPALKTAKGFGLATELGHALAFDIHVQNGSINAAAREQIQKELAAQPVRTEQDLRVIIANAVADKTDKTFREDVRSRKLTLATGDGRVHGATYLLRNWGLDDLPA
jgi:peptidoglycan hydrolase-like protein with peptidoglycan-binding domain